MKICEFHRFLSGESPSSYVYFQSGVFRLLLFSGKAGLFRIVFLNSSNSKAFESAVKKLVAERKILEGGQSLVLSVKELQGYLAGKVTKFSMKLDIKGTDFQKKVLNQLKEIPYGETASYSDIARETGSPKGARAVGYACNKNPLPIVIPCHRVISIGGKLTGYAPGINYKKIILQIERKKR